jgi:hypothetical protein
MHRYKTRKYEFSVLIAIIGLLALFLMNALQEMRDEFEKTAVQSEAAALRIYLIGRLAHHQLQGGVLPHSKNPVVWAGHAPGNYLGERSVSPEENSVWYYDTRRQELIYRNRSGVETRFRLAQGTEITKVSGTLGGVGLLRIN